VRTTGLIIAAAALALTACDPSSAGAPPAPATLGAPATDVAQLVATARAGIGEAESAGFTTAAVLGSTPEDVSGSLHFDGSTCNLRMILDGDEIRVLGKKTFTHAQQEAVPGKPWIGTDPESDDVMAQAAGMAVPVIVQLPDLGRALVEIERTGRIVSAEQTRLGDLPVNHYRLELDAAKAPDLFLEFAEPPMDNKPAKAITAKLPAELWLDAARRPVRFAIDLSAGMPEGARGAETTKGTTDYRDWGKPVDIQPPPADQVVDLSELIKKIGT
jgi:hypothetical protein